MFFKSFSNPSTGKEQWYKFDDGEVTECKMNEDDEMKAQCFGGDYMGEIYDSNLKRMQYRRQKRWWNAEGLPSAQESYDGYGQALQRF